MEATDAAVVNRSIVQEPPGSKRSRKPSEVVPYIRIFLGGTNALQIFVEVLLLC